MINENGLEEDMAKKFDWGKKKIGPPGYIPTSCYVCCANMALKGWEFNYINREIHCFSCGSQFKIDSD